MAQQRALPQSKETLLQSYNKRLKDDIKSIMDNFTEIIKTAKVRAGESLMKLVSDLKQFLILNDFPSVNEAIDQRNQQLRALQEECDRKLITLRDEISIDLYELEEEYYSSSSSSTIHVLHLLMGEAVIFPDVSIEVTAQDPALGTGKNTADPSPPEPENPTAKQKAPDRQELEAQSWLWTWLLGWPREVASPLRENFPIDMCGDLFPHYFSCGNALYLTTKEEKDYNQMEAYMKQKPGRNWPDFVVGSHLSCS
ncbi:mediator of RNA polymerase II transcription subunit 22 isoform X2 [Symphalangus syndactylus]|uniref:mediator of RNA polymerase II transcription subunit 22 isoform X2 n=1 Tax=Symphalangus syndactylus TaxID=9590 RepID=UPI00300618D1